MPPAWLCYSASRVREFTDEPLDWLTVLAAECAVGLVLAGFRYCWLQKRHPRDVLL